MEDQPKVETFAPPDICPTHKTAMMRVQEHIGDGKTRWSEPFCPSCREIEAGKETASEQTDVAKATTKPVEAGPMKPR